MLGILGMLTLVSGFVLLFYAMAAHRRPVRPAWTRNWIIGGATAPAVITLMAAGLIMLVRFALDFSLNGIGVVELVVIAAILVAGVLAWIFWKPNMAIATPEHAAVGGAPSMAAPANDPGGRPKGPTKSGRVSGQKTGRRGKAA